MKKALFFPARLLLGSGLLRLRRSFLRGRFYDRLKDRFKLRIHERDLRFDLVDAAIGNWQCRTEGSGGIPVRTKIIPRAVCRGAALAPAKAIAAIHRTFAGRPERNLAGFSARGARSRIELQWRPISVTRAGKSGLFEFLVVESSVRLPEFVHINLIDR